MTPEEIAARWPAAILIAREYRALFGDGVRLLYARNAQCDELGKEEERIKPINDRRA